MISFWTAWWPSDSLPDVSDSIMCCHCHKPRIGGGRKGRRKLGQQQGLLNRQATITSFNAGSIWTWRFPLMGDSNAPLAAEVERFRSNFMAHMRLIDHERARKPGR